MKLLTLSDISPTKVHYVHENGIQRGPFSLEELRSKHSQGLISDEALVWDESSETWVAISNFAAPVPPAPSEENTTQTEKDVSKLCAASTYCAIAAASITLLFAIFIKSPLQRMNEASQQILESAKENFENTKNKPPNEKLANTIKSSKDMMDVGIIGMIKGSLIQLLTLAVSILTCITGFILNVADAVKNRQISKRNIINAAANLLCFCVVIPGLTILFMLKGTTEVFKFLPF